MNTRALAAKTLANTLGAPHNTFQPATLSLPKDLSHGDRSFVVELCFTTLRWAPRLACFAHQLLHKPLPSKEKEIWALLLIGLAQCEYLRTPVHAAIDQTVQAADALKKPWAKGLLNASLRRFLREREALSAAFEDNVTFATAHPGWLVKRIKKAWPEQWQAIIDGNNQQGPMVLRVNKKHTTMEAYAQTLTDNGISFAPHPYALDAVVLDEATSIDKLPGFEEGLVSVQDASAQLACDLLAPASGARCLDLCAAPGGKAAHLLERHAELQLTALEKSAPRFTRLQQTFERLTLQAQLLHEDAFDYLPKNPHTFDAILLDAPCSGTGVIRRHPDIKVCRSHADLPELCATQSALLDAAWQALAPSGRLLYATCSILPEENEAQIRAFIERHKDAQPHTIDGPWGHAAGIGRYILPGESGMDGFYYALLTKSPAPLP